MPIFDVKCPSGHVTEVLLRSAEEPARACPACGESTHRLPSAGTLLGKASLPPSSAQAPTTWRGTHNGNPDVVNGWRRALSDRRKIEERYPELAPPKQTILAHEGQFHDAPLTVENLAQHAASLPTTAQSTGSTVTAPVSSKDPGTKPATV
ncbi:FmdB family zinc ribbon protein [Kineococcus rhizosphaerae]|uniref:Putative FmdB family regulatory protein n=1 Tax=Kineococcus rhizosphaerae TaxID=559628 RepID=A0A2T0QSC7_9ACTN|nr:zinc ribbon domain-containing protein [Kineococcus rhizosphaerae]PRY07810.1 putative FmdB family regulatory protein [Kineococcus rhizosphaerae]